MTTSHRAKTDTRVMAKTCFPAGRPPQQRLVSNGGWAEGSATFNGPKFS